MVTRAQVQAAKTVKGGFTREQLSKWGVAWPPPKGWMDKLLNEKSLS